MTHMNLKNKPWAIFLAVFLLISALVFGLLSSKKTIEKPDGIMILIEYENQIGTLGLSTFVNEMEKRNVQGLLMLTPGFVTDNCSEIKELMKHNVELVPSNVGAPFWDIPYEEQKSIITSMVSEIEACTGEPTKIISSRYMASDITTVKIAEELGIPYITARGTTDSKATVYQPEGYNVKILSVSNIPLVTFKYGSLCDYSFFERGGTPEDMLKELNRAIEPLSEKEKSRYGEYNKVTPVSHTRIGGYLKPWMNMWIEFWDNSEVNWVGLDEFMAKADWTMPLWQIPLNKNSPYTAEKMNPLVSYEDEEKVDNPCAVIDLEGADKDKLTNVSSEKMVVFHNGQGPMCLDFLDYIEIIDYKVEQHLSSESGFSTLLNTYRTGFEKSAGISETFGYYPLIFLKGQAFSGFNEEIKEELNALID